MCNHDPMPTEFRLPAGPKTPTVLNGILFLFAQEQIGRLLNRRYGDAWTLKLPTIGNTVFVSRPDLVKTMFTAKPDVLHGGENPLGDFFGPGSLFSMDGDEHLRERRMLLAPFHGDRMKSYHGLIEEEALRALRSWRDDVEFASLPTFNKITLRVILRAVFGAEGAQLTELEHMLPKMTQLGQKITALPWLGRDLGRWSIGGRYRPMRARYDEIIDGLIQQHLDDPGLDERIDILALMLRATLADGREVDRGAMSDELITLLAAGHETTASSLAFCVERLRRHPDVLRRLEEEAAGEAGEVRMATINEVHRTRPVIGGTGRMVKQPFEIGEWRLPPGTAILASGLTMHQDDRFHERAGAFDPDRYVGAKPDTYAWIPFGGGMRRCIGAAFALMEMDVVLRTMLRHFELLPTSEPAERGRFRGVATAPAKGGMAKVRRRAAPLGRQRGGATAAAAGCPVDHAALSGGAAA
jgi:cytochrome P450 family 138